MKKIMVALVLLVSVCACSDDKEDVNKFNISVVQKAESFIDTRDNTEYSCVRIGDQVWMTDNLRYILPKGPLDGCYTWGEKVVNAKSLLALDEDFVRELDALGNDKTFDWVAIYKIKFMLDLSDYIMYMPVGYITQEAVINDLKTKYPKFYEVLEPRLEPFKGPAAIESLKSQDIANGGYSKDNGYLYTLEAAKKAVPTEGGWRLPTDEDWLKLEATIGMNKSETDKLEAWRGVGAGTLLKKGGATGLNMRLSGGNMYTVENADLYLHRGEYGYYWTSTMYDEGKVEKPESPKEEGGNTDLSRTTVFIRSLAFHSDKIWRGTLRVNSKYNPVKCSVRLVRDAN